jgi:SAM-dependent methyltransferase
MPESLLVATLAKVRRHPWWHARASFALAVLRENQILPPASVLDVGCGWGVNLQALENAGYQSTGIDISRQILELIDLPGRRLIEADLNQPIPQTLERHDALLLLDVIEHLDDDRGVLRRVSQFLRPDGLAVVSVPALPELFSEFDRIQGHRRRYLPDTLREAFRDTGLAVSKICWWGAWMVPVLKRMRLKPEPKSGSAPKTYSDYLRVPPWPIPLFMKFMYAREKRRALDGRLSTGTSLFAIARRKE